MLTDYLRFCLVRKNDKGKVHIVQEYRICDLSQLRATLKNRALLESKEKELTELFKLFFTHSPKPIVAAKEFAMRKILKSYVNMCGACVLCLVGQCFEVV